jgi:hypothetical protein
MYSSLSCGEKKSLLTTMVRGGKPRSSARSSLVRLKSAPTGVDSPQHHPVQQDLQLFECRVSRSARFDTVPRDRGENLRVPETNMVHGFVSTLVAMSFIREHPMEGFTIALLAKVVTAISQVVRITHLNGSAPRNRTSEYSSPTRFCRGVPDRHHLYFAVRANAAFAALVDRSLILCASSRITLYVSEVSPLTHRCQSITCMTDFSLIMTLFFWKPLCCRRKDASRVPYDTRTYGSAHG